jgi:hypothetical protein
MVSPNLSVSFNIFFSFKPHILSLILTLHVTTPNPTTTNFLYLEHSELQSNNLVSFKQHHQHLIIG